MCEAHLQVWPSAGTDLSLWLDLMDKEDPGRSEPPCLDVLQGQEMPSREPAPPSWGSAGTAVSRCSCPLLETSLLGPQR